MRNDAVLKERAQSCAAHLCASAGPWTVSVASASLPPWRRFLIADWVLEAWCDHSSHVTDLCSLLVRVALQVGCLPLLRGKQKSVFSFLK